MVEPADVGTAGKNLVVLVPGEALEDEEEEEKWLVEEEEEEE